MTFMRQPVATALAHDATLGYRPDVDGLRAVAVLMVFAFHLGLPGMAGGFVGVDVFFVISGFLIASIVRRDVEARRFSLVGFYRRRVLRIAPALLATLALALVASFILDPQDDFDFFGKQTLFAALGVSNFLFAAQTNYFGPQTPPLVHTWSLGVEEQFYLVFPVALLALRRLGPGRTAPALAVALLALSALPFLEPDPMRRYFLPQNRAFELLFGVVLAYAPPLPAAWRAAAGWAGAALLALSLAVIDASTPFPGAATWLPLLGAGALVAAGPSGPVSRALAWPPAVFVGLLSYPLYLVHVPVIHHLERHAGLEGAALAAAAAAASLALAAAIHRWVEGPARRLRLSTTRRQGRAALGLAAGLVAVAAAGAHAALNEGWPRRFDVLNPFAAQVAEAHRFGFDHRFAPGYVEGAGPPRVLFVGDSLLQHYVAPAARALDLAPAEIDLATRAGCVLTPVLGFRDAPNRVSCDAVRERLYGGERRYELVVLGQAWANTVYARAVADFRGLEGEIGIDRWIPLVRDAIGRLRSRSERFVVLGWHPEVVFDERALTASLLLSPARYRAGLRTMALVETERAARETARLREALADMPGVSVLDPTDLLCDGAGCRLHDGVFSFFRDEMHLNVHAEDTLAARLRVPLQGP